MPFNPSTGGGTRGGWRPGAGRPKGSLNKQTEQTRKLLKDMGCNPIEAMAKIAMDESNPIEIRAAMFRDLAGYFTPKLRSMDLNANVASELTVIRKVFSEEGALEHVNAQDRAVLEQSLSEGSDESDEDDD